MIEQMSLISISRPASDEDTCPGDEDYRISVVVAGFTHLALVMYRPGPDLQATGDASSRSSVTRN